MKVYIVTLSRYTVNVFLTEDLAREFINKSENKSSLSLSIHEVIGAPTGIMSAPKVSLAIDRVMEKAEEMMAELKIMRKAADNVLKKDQK